MRKRLRGWWAVPLLVLLGITASLGAENRIVPGQTISITVLGSPELSQTVLVKEDGTTEYPLLAGVPLDGMTATEVRDLLLPILSRFVDRPRVFVTVSDIIPVPFRVQGQVRRAGSYLSQGPIDLQAALTMAGGPTELADLRHVVILRGNKTNTKSIEVNLFAALDSMNVPMIERNDLIVVTAVNSQSYVRVMGAVRAPGNYLSTHGMDVIDMIMMAGGASKEADLKRVRFIHRTPDGSYTINQLNLKKLVSATVHRDIPLVGPGDMIFIEERPWWSRGREVWPWVQSITSIVSLFVILQRI